MPPRPKSNRATIKTVAEDAGVSVAAVSKVLRDAYGVSDALRSRVEASIQRLGYRPQSSARGMRGQSYTLGVLLPDFHNPFFSDIVSGLNAALERTKYQALYGIGQSVTGHEQALIDAMMDHQMDGIIVVGPRMPQSAVDEVARVTPLAIIGHHAETNAYDTVNNDDELGASLVVRHLASEGYRNIAMLTLALPPTDGAQVTTQREIGYRRAMDEASLRRYVKVVQAEQTSREVQLVVRQLLGGRGRPDAIFCWTDFIALEVLSVAREMGLSVPGDIAVVGYDNTAYCELAQNALTSVDQSGQVLGLQAARLLIERIAGRQQAEHFVVTPRLVVRGSSSVQRRP